MVRHDQWRKKVRCCFLAILVIMRSGATLNFSFFDKPDLRFLLPTPEEFKGWQAEGGEQVFEGTELFSYINGGAEIYLEYGFRRVLAQEYKDAEGHRLSLEIFDMDSPESAYGIFSFKRSASGKPVDLGDEADLADYYLNVWKGHFLITITGLDTEAKTLTAILELGKLVAEKIEGGQPRPTLLDLYPEEGIVPQSLRFFKGPLGLLNSYPFFRGYVFSTSRAARADYLSGESVYLFEYPDEHSCLKASSEVRKAFFQDVRYTDAVEEGATFRVTDHQGRPIFGGVRKNYLVLIINSRDIRAAVEFLDRLEQRMPR